MLDNYGYMNMLLSSKGWTKPSWELQVPCRPHQRDVPCRPHQREPLLRALLSGSINFLVSHCVKLFPGQGPLRYNLISIPGCLYSCPPSLVIHTAGLRGSDTRRAEMNTCPWLCPLTLLPREGMNLIWLSMTLFAKRHFMLVASLKKNSRVLCGSRKKNCD